MQAAVAGARDGSAASSSTRRARSLSTSTSNQGADENVPPVVRRDDDGIGSAGERAKERPVQPVPEVAVPLLGIEAHFARTAIARKRLHESRLVDEHRLVEDEGLLRGEPGGEPCLHLVKARCLCEKDEPRRSDEPCLRERPAAAEEEDGAASGSSRRSIRRTGRS
jgi:hypothetical protein